MPIPAVSVAIPTHNAAAHLRDTLRSVLAQTLADFELIISDDASADDTLKIPEEFADPRIRILTNSTNTGLAANWNRAVHACGAPYIKLLCQDDLIYPDCLEQQLSILTDPAHADVGFVTAPRDVIDAAGRTRLRARRRWPTGTTPGPSALRKIVRSGTNPVGEPAAVMFRADVFNRSGGFHDTLPYMIDVDFYCRVLRTTNLYCLPNPLAAFRLSPMALSSALAKDQSRQASAFFSALAFDPAFPVTRTDARLGSLKATFLAPARRMAYRLFQ